MVVQLDRPQVLAPQQSQKTLPARLIFAAQPQAPVDVPKVQNGPNADVFQSAGDSSEGQSKAAQASDRLAELLTTSEDRKANAAAFFQAVTGKLPFRVSLEAQAEKQAELQALAETVKQMNPQQKVALMQKLTGTESPYSKVAETVLINQQLPNLKDVANLFKPQAQQKSLEGLSVAIQGVGLGLLLLPILCPASILFRPELLGQFAAGLAVILL